MAFLMAWHKGHSTFYKFGFEHELFPNSRRKSYDFFNSADSGIITIFFWEFRWNRPCILRLDSHPTLKHLFHVKSSCIKNSRTFYFSENILNCSSRSRKSRDARLNICFIYFRQKCIFLFTTSINNKFILSFADFQSRTSFLRDYDTGSPQPICRSQVKTNGHFSNYMQVSYRHQIRFDKSQFPS